MISYLRISDVQKPELAFLPVKHHENWLLARHVCKKENKSFNRTDIMNELFYRRKSAKG